MDDESIILVWGIIGLGMSLGAMILPFQRGPIGVGVNMIVCIVGGILGGLATRQLTIWLPLTRIFSIVGAAFGAIFVSLALHFVWNQRHQRRIEARSHR